MTDILCKWLNEDVCLEPKLSKSSFAEVFSNGYLFGEVLHKHGLQPDFPQFSNARSSEAKLNNFTRLEPTFKLLEIPFNINMARDVMTERPGVATRLLYQLFVALNRVKEGRVTGQSLESVRPSGRVKLEKIETGIFQKRLKQQTPRQVDLNFEGLIQKFQERQRSFEEKMSTERRKEEDRIQQERRDLCHKSLEKSREVRERQAVLYAKLKPLSPDKPPTNTRSRTTGSLMERSRARRLQDEVLATREGIDQFEATLSLRSAPVGESRPMSTGNVETVQSKGPSSDYVAQIRKRVQDSDLAHKEREKHRRKVLVEQMQALQEQENARRERVLVERLMRQCQQERRIATQLMAIRKEKDTIRNNRIFRLQQYEEQRVREFNEALDRERELARCEVKEKADKLQLQQEVYKQHRAQLMEQNYQKDYAMCRDMLMLIVDLASKLAHYRELTNKLVPAKLVVDWKTLFISGKSAYDDPPLTSDPIDPMSESIASTVSSSLRKNNSDLLDQADLREYKDALCDWSTPEAFPAQLPCPTNTILSHVVYRLQDMVDPPKPPPSPPVFPKLQVRASFVGRPFAGKSTVLKRLEQDFPILNVLNPEDLVTKAVATYLSEKRLLESQLSTETGVGECDSEQPTPVISVEVCTPVVDSPQEGANEEGQTLGSASTLSEQLVSQLSPLGQLGHKAHSAVTNGDCVDDQTVVEIIVHEMRTLSDNSGVILDNYPVTLDQVHVLMKAVYGDVTPMVREFKLLPKGADQSAEQPGVSDLLLLFKVTTDNLLLRASQEGSDDHPLGSNKLEQVQHRLLSFDTEWPQLRRHFVKNSSIISIDANQDHESVYKAVKDQIQEVLNKAKYTDAFKKLGISPEQSTLSSGSATNLTSPTKTKSPRSPDKPSSRTRHRPSSTSSLRVNAAVLQAISKAAFTEAEPGDPDWVYCDGPLSTELAKGLAQMWPALEKVYLGTLKEVFQQLRAEREAICHYFYEKRTEFGLYLGRPDTKQEFVSQWQSSYNSLTPHLRREDLMKAELHQRVDDLCEKLWDISDHHREGAKLERERILSDNWLEDHVGLLTNHYISIMQAEMDRFYSTYLLLKDYYTGMEEKVPVKLPDPGRLALVELPPTEPQDPPSSNTTSSHNIQEEEKNESKEVSTASLSPKRSLSKKRRVPLLPRQLLPEPTEDKAPKKKGGGAVAVTPPPPVEDISGLGLDEQLVVHAYNNAIGFVFTTVAHEMKVLEGAIADLSKPPPASQPADPPPEPQEEKSGKGKKEKAKSPAGKKGKASPGKGAKAVPPSEPAPEPPAPKLSPSELAKKQRSLLMHREHRAALQQEETRVKLRLELIKVKSLGQLEGIKETASVLGDEMEQWLGDTFKQEVDCVNSLAEILRQAIENEQKLLNEIVLPGVEITIKESCLLSDPTRPSSPLPPIETAHPHIFTVSQLLSLHAQLISLSPDGYMLFSSLVDTLVSLAERSGDGAILPDHWTSLTREQFEQLCEGVYGAEAVMVYWRRLLVSLAQPWSSPSPQQLLEALTSYWAVDDSGYVSREQYCKTAMWLDESGEERDTRLKQAFFEMFSEVTGDRLDYTSLLLYLCSDYSSTQGLLKAITVVTAGDVSNDHQASLCLEDLNKVLTHGTFSEDSSTSLTSVLFDLFLTLSPGHPNEVSLRDMMNKDKVWGYLTSVSPYTLTTLDPFLRPASRLTETD